jgi:hypothetical protein
VRFPYTETVDEPDGSVWEPLVLVRVIGLYGDVLSVGALDTGSPVTLLPREDKERLGVVIETVREFSGVGGGRVRAEFGIVDLELVSLDRRTSYRWAAWVGFCRRDRALWGHLGFLDHFTTSFDGERKQVSLRPNRTMPGPMPRSP